MNQTEHERRFLFVDLGCTSVPDVERLMNSAGQLRVTGEVDDVLFVLSHPKTVALGLRDGNSSRPEDLLVPIARLQDEGIALTRSVRGGGITYHWPGQIVCYPVMGLGPDERSIPRFMTKLEEVATRALRSIGVEATRRRDSAAYLGLWTDGCKIVSMGIRVSKWVTSFGFALNLEGDLSPSRYVRPCGLQGVYLTTVEKTLGSAPPRPVVVRALIKEFGSVFDRQLVRMQDHVLTKIRSSARPGDTINEGSG